MALTLLTRSYTSTYAGFVVVVKDENGVPARLYNSARGGLLSKDGRVKLPATGVFSAYVNDDTKYVLSLLSSLTGQVVSNEHDVDAGALRSSETYTFATLPGSSTATLGDRCFVSDIGSGDAAWVWTGSRWKPTGPIVLFRSATDLGCTDTTTAAQPLYTSPAIPAGLIGPSDTLRITAVFTATNDAVVKTPILEVTDGTQVANVYAAGLSSWASVRAQGDFFVRNLSSQCTTSNSSTGFGSSATFTSTTMNLSTAVLLVRAKAQFGTAGTGTNNITLRTLIVELVPF